MKPVQLVKVVGSIFAIAAACRARASERRGSEGVRSQGADEEKSM
jgi:hypothetical protein